MKNIPDVIKMTPLAIECPVAGCDLGENKAKYKTPALAMELMKIHGHSHQQVQGAASGSVSNKNMRERQKKPTAGIEMSETKWRDFMNQWARYKRSSVISGQDIVDVLFLCLSDELRLEVTSEGRERNYHPL